MLQIELKEKLQLILSSTPIEQDDVELKQEDILFNKTTGKLDATSTRAYIDRYLSAFSNYGGGLLLIGVTDAGKYLNGVPIVFGAKRIEEWLTGICSTATEPKALFKVYTFIPSDLNAEYANNGNCILVIEVLANEHAPIQTTRDRAFYRRSGATCAGLTRIELDDIYNRECLAFADLNLHAYIHRSFKEERFLRAPFLTVSGYISFDKLVETTALEIDMPHTFSRHFSWQFASFDSTFLRFVPTQETGQYFIRNHDILLPNVKYRFDLTFKLNLQATESDDKILLQYLNNDLIAALEVIPGEPVAPDKRLLTVTVLYPRRLSVDVNYTLD